MAFARIGGGDDDADGFLIEAFEAAMALKVFEMAADSAFFQELIELLLGDEFGQKEAFGAFGADLPAFAFSESLAEEFEVGEGFHGVDAAALELIAEEIEIETGFEVVHAGFEKTFAVEADPESYRAESQSGRELFGGEINLGFFGHEVHVGEDHDADDRLLGNLRAPTGFRAGVVALAFLEAEFEQKFDEIDEIFARAAEGVMIMVAPAEAELILTAFLDLARAIAVLPISTLG